MLSRVFLMAVLLMASLVSVEAQNFKPMLVVGPEEGAIIGYFDRDWQQVDKNTQHSFYRKVIKVENDGYILQDFFSHNNAKQTDPFKVYDQASFGASKIGLRNGSMTLWRSDGTKSEQTDYKNGAANGEFRVWHHNGELRVLGYYKENRADGLWIFWDERGKKRREAQYVNGEKVAQWDF